LIHARFQPDLHELFRILHRQHAEHDGVDQAENGCVGADAQRERKQCNAGDERSFAENAKGETNVLEDAREKIAGVLSGRDGFAIKASF